MGRRIRVVFTTACHNTAASDIYSYIHMYYTCLHLYSLRARLTAWTCISCTSHMSSFVSPSSNARSNTLFCTALSSATSVLYLLLRHLLNSHCLRSAWLRNTTHDCHSMTFVISSPSLPNSLGASPGVSFSSGVK